MPCLKLEEHLLAFQATGVAGELATLADHPMTWHDDRERIATDSLPHLMGERATAKCRCQFPVRDGLSIWDLAERGPHSLLERITLCHGPQVECVPLASEVLLELVCGNRQHWIGGRRYLRTK